MAIPRLDHFQTMTIFSYIKNVKASKTDDEAIISF